MFRKRSVDSSGELSWVLRVGVGEAVQVCRSGGLNREVTRGEFGSGGGTMAAIDMLKLRAYRRIRRIVRFFFPGK